MKTGTVKFFNGAKGFGFIRPDNESEDVFVHETGLIDSVSENDRVEFNTERGKRGINAIEVKKID